MRHDPQRFMGKTITVPHFNRDTVEFASRKRDESNSRDQNTDAFSEKHYRRERFGEFSRSHSGLRCLLLASQDNFNKFIAIRRIPKTIQKVTNLRDESLTVPRANKLVAIFHISNYLTSKWYNRVIPQLRVSSDLTGHT